MAMLRAYERSSIYTPASYTTTSTDAIFGVVPGDLVVGAFHLISVAFDGGSSDAALELGDDGDVNRFSTTTNTTAATLDAEADIGTGAGFANAPGFLYTAANNIDVVFTRDTGADGTVGECQFWVYIAKIFPGGTT